VAIKSTQLYDGDTLRIFPEVESFKFECCTCGLIHKITITREDNGIINLKFEEANNLPTNQGEK